MDSKDVNILGDRREYFIEQTLLNLEQVLPYLDLTKYSMIGANLAGEGRKEKIESMIEDIQKLRGFFSQQKPSDTKSPNQPSLLV